MINKKYFFLIIVLFAHAKAFTYDVNIVLTMEFSGNTIEDLTNSDNWKIALQPILNAKGSKTSVTNFLFTSLGLEMLRKVVYSFKKEKIPKDLLVKILQQNKSLQNQLNRLEEKTIKNEKQKICITSK